MWGRGSSKKPLLFEKDANNVIKESPSKTKQNNSDTDEGVVLGRRLFQIKILQSSFFFICILVMDKEEKEISPPPPKAPPIVKEKELTKKLPKASLKKRSRSSARRSSTTSSSSGDGSARGPRKKVRPTKFL